MPGTTKKNRKPRVKKTDAAVVAEAAAETTVVEDAPAAEPKTKTRKWDDLPDERIAYIRANARPAVAPCLCGCGSTTKGRFFPGHDATLKATLTEMGDTETLAAFGW